MTAVSRPSGRRREARVRMVLVRLVECSALVLLLSAAHEMWAAWDNAGFDGFLGRSGPLVLDRVWSVVHNLSRGPVAAALAALLLGGCLWALHRIRPVASAPVLRVEVGLLVMAGLVLELVAVAVVAVAWAVPYGPDQGPSPLAVGEDQLTALLPVVAWPVAGFLLYLVLGGAWWLLRTAGAEEAEEAEEVLPSTDAEPPEGVHAEEAVPADETGSPRAEAEGDGIGEVGHVAGAQAPDGSTGNGYEEYFRRR